MLGKARYAIFAILFAGCTPPAIKVLEPLDPFLQEVVFDYQAWIEESEDELKRELEKDPKWNSDILGISETSQNAEYFQYETFKRESTAAYSYAPANSIGLVYTHYVWNNLDCDAYIFNRGAYYDCQPEGALWIEQTSRPFNVLAHENGHLLRIGSHKNIYKLGYAIEDMEAVRIEKWESECYDFIN